MTDTSPFAALAADVDEPFRVELLSPINDLPIKSKDGKATAYVEVLSADSDVGKSFDRARRAAMQRRLGRGKRLDEEDSLEVQIEKLARLTTNWLLIDPKTGEEIKVACTPENARQLYASKGTDWIYHQVWLASVETGNFMTPSKKTSSSGRKGSSVEG